MYIKSHPFAIISHHLNQVVHPVSSMQWETLSVEELMSI